MNMLADQFGRPTKQSENHLKRVGSKRVRVVQNYIVNFRHQKFASDFANYYFFLAKSIPKMKTFLKIEQRLDMSISNQSFST